MALTQRVTIPVSVEQRQISLLCPRGMLVYRGFTHIGFVVFILHLAPVVQRLESATKRKIHYPVYKSYQSELSSLVHRDLTSE